MSNLKSLMSLSVVVACSVGAQDSYASGIDEMNQNESKATSARPTIVEHHRISQHHHLVSYGDGMFMDVTVRPTPHLTNNVDYALPRIEKSSHSNRLNLPTLSLKAQF